MMLSKLVGIAIWCVFEEEMLTTVLSCTGRCFLCKKKGQLLVT